MKYYEMRYSCGIFDEEETSAYVFPDSWTKEDIYWFFVEGIEDYAARHLQYASLPFVENYLCEEDYEDALRDARKEWEDTVRSYSFYEEITKEEYNELVDY